MPFDRSQTQYDRFRSIVKERTHPFSVWVGAGVSAQAGLCTWGSLKNQLISALRSKAPGIEDDDREKLNGRITYLEQEEDGWIAFQILFDTLGEATYRSTIRQALAPAESCIIPEVYNLLWKLRPKGMLSLNLDRLAARSHSEVNPGKLVHEFDGWHAGSSMACLKSSAPFIANLHGILNDCNSWVLTRKQFDALVNHEPYRVFLHSCLTTQTILFMGLSADDPAVDNFLRYLSQIGVDFGEHFWLTHRRDSLTDRWAESKGLQIIRYRCQDDNHAEVTEFLDDLLSYIPVDSVPAPVIPSLALSDAPMPDPEVLLTLSPDQARIRLNQEAARILIDDTPEAFSEYRAFLKKYDRAIYNSWYVSHIPPNNKLLDYELLEQIAEGAFGEVYRARDTAGQEVAVKILRSSIRREEERLQCFRRGVRSMSILSQRQVAGMVAYRAAGEIPAFVVMDVIEGPNLRTAVESHYVDRWSDIIKASKELSHIILSAHSVPERVLHRDIRPPNIMLSGYYLDPEDWHIVVLDFDLSWHRDAYGASLTNPATMTGFLAPEQFDLGMARFRRNAAVDSFGLGMTFYYLCARREPAFAQHRHSDWITTLRQFIAARKCPTWQSLPERFARLVYCTTRDRQEDRWDVSQVCGELDRLSTALEGCSDSAELIAEELLYRALGGQPYDWNPNKLIAEGSLPGGIYFSVKGDEVRLVIELELRWENQGTSERRLTSRWVRPAMERACAQLSRVGWRVSPDYQGDERIAITASAGAAQVLDNIDTKAKGVAEAIKAISFS